MPQPPITSTRKRHRIAIVGATGHLGRELLGILASEFPDADFVLMARARSDDHLRARIGEAVAWSIGPEADRERSRFIPLRIDLSRSGLGLDDSGNALLNSVDEIFFLASNISFAMSEEEALEANVRTVRNFLDTCTELRTSGCPRTLHYVSTAYVATTADGVASPSPPDVEARFRNSYEYSKALAEQEVRNSGIPFMIYRPSIIIGSSRTGRAFGFDTVYNFVRAYADDRLPFVPAEPDHVLDIVPSDYVGESIAALARTGQNLTFHICAGDRAPTAHELYENIRRTLVGHRGGHGVPELRFFPPDLITRMGTAPHGLASSRMRSASRLISAYLPFLSPGVPSFDITATIQATGVHPPLLEDYGERVWSYALDHGFGSRRGRAASSATAPAPARRSGASAARRTDPTTLDGTLARTAECTPGKAALVSADGTLTYADLEAGVHERSRALTGHGVGPGTRVTLTMAHDTASVITYLGAVRAGANVLLLPEGASPPPEWGRTAVLTPRGRPSGHDPAPDPALAGGTAFATSGTTGRPKLVQHTSGSSAMSGRAAARATRLDGSERIALLLPLFHAFAAGIVVPAALRAGSCLTLPRADWSGLEAMSRTRATHAVGVPTHFHGFVEEWRERSADGPTGLDLSNWAVSMCGDDPVLPALRETFERTFLRPMAQGYGLSEALLLCFTAAVGAEAPDCVGLPLPGVGIAVRGPGGEALPLYRRGRIWVSAPTAMAGYVGRAPHRSEWIDTGDIGFVDDAGRLHVNGRFLRQEGIAEVAEFNGRSVTSRDVEDTLLRSDGVRRAKVVFTEDTAHAFVVAEADTPEFDTRELSDVLGVPTRITVVPSLAETPVGKVDRSALHRMITAP
ncbi:AMP-binding protein [Nocardiopsis sp. CC223A]|uniref:AMP-binding protein n=1 Tax=Nocardiopsis sp. CC223A TaxID=3044051 RepID=UPI00278C2141|nr:AMP-binding protein [Nocardiopsis sp. CC223A]